LDPRQGTYMLGGISLLSAFTALYTISKFGRKTVFLVGHALIAILHFLIAYSIAN